MTIDPAELTPHPRPHAAQGGEFRTTQWTQVSRAKLHSPEGRRALTELCDAYYEPVVAFLRCELRDADAARELAHDFFADVLEGEAIAHARQERGRFRSYLLGAVKHFLSHQRDAARRLKRGSGAESISINIGSPWRFNQFVGEWFIAIREAAVAATGRAAGQTPAGQLGVPPGSRMIPALLLGAVLAPIILGGLAVWLMVSTESVLEFGRSSTPQEAFGPVLIFLVILGGAAAALGGGWFHRRNRGPAQPSVGASTPAARQHTVVGCIFMALVLAPLVFTIVVGVYLLAYRVASLPSPTPCGSLNLKQIAYCLYREEEFHVAQCLNVDVSSFGSTREEAVANLKEAVELYFEGETALPFTAVADVSIGQEMVNA